MMLIRYTILTLLAAALLVCSRPATPSSRNFQSVSPTVWEIAAGYTEYRKITESEVFVNPELAALCRGASLEEVEAARIRHGPHANTGILIYMNEQAADTFAKNASPFPVGAVIVKRKTVLGYSDQYGNRFHPGDNGVGGMVKRSSGYDPMHGDWEYFYFENAAKIESGPIRSCVRCHSSAKDTDYVFGTWRKPGG